MAHGIKEEEDVSLIMVKALMVKDISIHTQMREEIEFFTKSDHPHVSRILGICRDREPIYVMFEYCDWVSGNQNGFL